MDGGIPRLSVVNHAGIVLKAVGATTLADDVKLVMRNCVINNNTVKVSAENAENVLLQEVDAVPAGA